MWLDPLILREWLPNIQQWSEHFNVRTLLLEQKYAVENPEVFMYLYFYCFGTVGVTCWCDWLGCRTCDQQIGRSRVQFLAGTLPGSLGQLSLPSLRGR